jgi:hypothetical protein
MTLPTTTPYAGMGCRPHLDRFRLLVSQHLHFVVYEANKTLHPIQDGLNLKLNSWFPPFDCFCADNKRLIEIARSAIPTSFSKNRIFNIPSSSRLWEMCECRSRHLQAVWESSPFGNFPIQRHLPQPCLPTNSAVQPKIDEPA